MAQEHFPIIRVRKWIWGPGEGRKTRHTMGSRDLVLDKKTIGRCTNVGHTVRYDLVNTRRIGKRLA